MAKLGLCPVTTALIVAAVPVKYGSLVLSSFWIEILRASVKKPSEYRDISSDVSPAFVKSHRKDGYKIPGRTG
jgi:hypothetical protein